MPSTPILAIPYPAGTDRVMDGDNAMQAIAERVEALLLAQSGSALGYAEVTAPQAGIVGSEVDLTGLAVTVTVPAGHRVKITASVSPSSTGTGEVVICNIKESAATLKARTVPLGPVNLYGNLEFSHVARPATGAHTYRLSMQRVTALGSVTNQASATNASHILVEDLGV